MSESMQIVFNAMLPSGEILTDESISALRTIFGERDIAEIGSMTPLAIASEIVVNKDSSGFPNGIQPADAAVALIDCMRKLGAIAAPEQPTPTVKIELPKTPDQMTLSELLTQLRNDPSLYSDLVPHIEELPAVKKAAWKAPNWALRDAAGKLDVNATVGYVAHLNKRASWVRTEVGGQRPTSLARICGQEERPMLNPFATNRDELVVTGPFFDDFDLGNLSEERHLAYLWAMKTNHPAWPRPIDPYVHVAEAFAEELKGRWKKMVDAYNAAKKDNDPTTEGLLRYAPADYVSGSRLPFGGEPEQPKRDEAWYLQQLRDYAQSPIRTQGSDVRRSNCILTSVSTSGGDISLTNVIVLNGVHTSGGDISGTFYLLNGSVHTSGGDNYATVYKRSAQKLYELARQWGVFSSEDITETPSSESESRGGVTFVQNNYGSGGHTFTANTMTFGRDNW